MHERQGLAVAIGFLSAAASAVFSQFLDLPVKSIGRIGGRHKPTGLLDVAVIQSLVRKGVLPGVGRLTNQLDMVATPAMPKPVTS